jgi:glycosyltransferase involved in cell wall biosynthesis
MKILQIVQKPQRRGAEVFAYHLSQELRCQNHSVQTLYLYPYQGGGALPLTQNAQCLHGREAHPFERAVGVHPQLLQRLLRVIDEFQPDIVQVNGARTVKYGAVAHRLRRRQWALVYRNIGNPQDWMHSIQHRLFYKYLVMPQLDGIVGVSRTTLANLQKIYHLPIPLQNIPRGVDPKALQPQLARADLRAALQTDDCTPVILYVGSLTPEKRLDRLLAVFQQVQAKLMNARLWIVGDGPLRKELEQQAKALGVAPAIHFLGVQADVASYMAAADLLALTSDTEGIPGVILEAGFLRLPVVATNVGGVAECVIDGQTGILVDPQQETNLTTAILGLLQNPSQRTEMGKLAQTWVLEKFTIERIAQQYLAFYTEVLTKVRARS